MCRTAERLFGGLSLRSGLCSRRARGERAHGTGQKEASVHRCCLWTPPTTRNRTKLTRTSVGLGSVSRGTRGRLEAQGRGSVYLNLFITIRGLTFRFSCRSPTSCFWRGGRSGGEPSGGAGPQGPALLIRDRIDVNFDYNNYKFGSVSVPYLILILSVNRTEL